jgi:Ca2+-binding EF-hand superfamily protein
MSGDVVMQQFNTLLGAFIAGILQTEDGGDEEALGKLFMRIDANCDGTLDWDEFSNYMLLESQV